MQTNNYTVMGQNTQQSPGDERQSVIVPFFTALRFLTVIPLSWRADKDGELFQRSLYYFPVVGLLIGCLGVLVCNVTGRIFPSSVTAVIVMFYLSAISGFLHLDGLADSADGLLSARPREQSLAIMKDSRTGAMGVVILIIVLLGKYAALSTMPLQIMLSAALCMPLAGRCAILITMAFQPYARPEGGLGNLFYSAGTRYAALLGCSILLLVTMFHGGQVLALLVGCIIIFTVTWFSSFCKTRLGGVTGDTLGAVCELTEMSVAIGLTTMI